MSIWDQMMKLSKKHNHRLTKFCQPLQTHFGINHFCVYNVTNDGYYSQIGTNLPWSDLFFTEELQSKLQKNALLHPDHYQTKYLIARMDENETLRASVIQKIHAFETQQQLCIIEKTPRGMMGFAFGTNGSDKSNFVLFNELAALGHFIERFKEDHEDILYAIEDEWVDLAGLTGPKFYDVVDKKQKRNAFLNDIGASSQKLSKREQEVLLYVCKGFSARQAAEELGLAYKTVEHYIENIKNKLSCYSKADLVQKGLLLI